MSTETKMQAVELRRSGKSIREIESLIGCSRSSISRWVKDVPLSIDQQKVLMGRNPAYNMQCCIRGGEVVAQKWDKIRTEYREEGAIAARKQEVLHASACMLYWGEGSKSRYLTQMTNSDPDVHRLFISFLRKYFITRDEDMSIAINCHTDLHTLEEIENYWLCQLGLPRSSLRKGTVNYPLRQLERKKHQHKKCEYGTCALKIKRSIRIVQHIYGALEEYKKGLIVI